MTAYVPLAERLRAVRLEDVVGQTHLLGNNKPLTRMLASGRLHSMIFWGPPGTGKTTLARLLAQSSGASWRAISAVHDGVKDIKRVLDEAHADRALGQRSLLFVDEIHRFNKSQQDALLPAVESGLITLIGATTENPSFSLNKALLSRARVYVLKSLDDDAMKALMQKGLHALAQELGLHDLSVEARAISWLLAWADGDGRRLLNLLEQLADFAQVTDQGGAQISAEAVQRVLAGGQTRRFDRQGDAFYDQISALHKAVRGSAPDAALYWLVRLLDGGCDPLYLSRRLVRMASEDIGNADPRALAITLDAMRAYEILGSPEGELALAQAVLYLATSPKSNAVYKAYKAACRDVALMPSLEVPLRFRNAPTRLMQALNYGKGYRYAHDEPHAYAAGERYFPDEMPQVVYYQPVDRGYEHTIAQRLAFWRALDAKQPK